MRSALQQNATFETTEMKVLTEMNIDRLETTWHPARLMWMDGEMKKWME